MGWVHCLESFSTTTEHPTFISLVVRVYASITALITNTIMKYQLHKPWDQLRLKYMNPYYYTNGLYIYIYILQDIIIHGVRTQTKL